MLIECETIRLIHRNENFQLIACIPLGEYDNITIHPRYHTITIKDPTNRLVLNKVYTLEVSELTSVRYGIQYLLEDIPSLSFDDINDITETMELELLQEIMTDRQAEYVHNAYPDFIKRILSNQSGTIDINKIKNVSDKRLAQYIRKINKRYNTIILRSKVKYYDLKPQECSELLLYCDTVSEAINCVENNPYFALINICHRYFRTADVQILQHNSEWKYKQERIEYMLDYAISVFETDGSTYVDAVRLANYIYSIDKDVVPMLKDVAEKSDMIVYDEERNILQRKITYLMEYDIGLFLSEKVKHSTRLEWDWQKHTKIKDGKLTEEQQNVLRLFCETNILILDAPSGTGKTSSLMALIHMIEDNQCTYILMSPTGKAASRLSEQTGRTASTIHRATLSNSLYDKDIIIVDEASMLSIDLMTMIITQELLPTCRFVFVGDSAQIPSIGLGRVFKDMGESNIIPKCTLTKCFRFEEGGASYISTLTRQGGFYFTPEQIQHNEITLGEKCDYKFIKFDYTIEQIIDTYMSIVNSGVSPKDIMLLVPYNIGTFGAININNLIQAKLNPINDGKGLRTKHNDTTVVIHPNDLVMNIKNNYNALSYKAYDDMLFDDSLSIDDIERTSVFNGQTGRVIAIEYNENLGGNILIVDIEGEKIVYTHEEANNLLLAYASNPYKFQGSQCKYIINVIIPAHERSWNRQLLYTSQTRMTEKLIEIGDINIINHAVHKMGDDSRKTRLKEFLRT